jgi:hypothetical protein
MTDSPISQSDLDGFVDSTRIDTVLGLSNQDERGAVNRAPKTFTVVHQDDIRSIRTVPEKADERVFYTVETARGLLPPEYGPRDVDGALYPALKTVPTRRIRGYGKTQVAELQRALKAFRADAEERRLARVKERQRLHEAWLSGDATVSQTFRFADRSGWTERAV